MRWAYGVTTVPSRITSYLPRTLASLAGAGFDTPRLFLDGGTHRDAMTLEVSTKLEVTARTPAVRAYGSWVLALWELYLRQPDAERYALFQDDMVTYKNLKTYLDKSKYPAHGYCNLYTMPSNDGLRPKDNSHGWYVSNQFGRGAVALVFSREAVVLLLSHQHMVERAMDTQIGHRKIDGGVVDAMRKAGWTEYVHYPSLVQHFGDVSAIGNKPHKQAETFIGEEFNAEELIVQ